MIYVLTVTMLPVEFYMLNATTVLLWLCQICSHESVIDVLIALGVLCVLGSVSVIVFRVAFRCSVFCAVLCASHQSH